MKVYVAAPWKRKKEAALAAEMLEREGFEITERWWDHRETTDEQELADQAIADVEGVESADLFLLLNLEKSEGKAVETGFALANGITVFMVGFNSNVFHNLPDVYQFPSVAMAVGGAIMYRRMLGGA